MTTPFCRSCGHLTELLQSRHSDSVYHCYYCPACGWNVARARELVAFQRRNVQVAAGVILLVQLLVIPTYIANGRLRDGIVLGTILMAMIAILAGLALRRLGKDARALAALPSHFPPRSTPLSKPDAATMAQFELARSMSRPRTVQLNANSRSFSKLIMILSLGVFVWGCYDLFFARHSTTLASRAAFQAPQLAFLILPICVVVWSRLSRSLQNPKQLRILRHGDIALARVTGPMVGNVGRIGITYAFEDFNGRSIQGRGVDLQRLLDEDDYVVVLYDPLNSENSVPLCATNYEFEKI